MKTEEFIREKLLEIGKDNLPIPRNKSFEDVVKLILLGRTEANWPANTAIRFCKKVEQLQGESRTLYKTRFLKFYGVFECFHCSELLDLSLHSSTRNLCRCCDAKRSASWREVNPEKAKETRKRHYEANKHDYILRSRDRRDQISSAIPCWADMNAIKYFYSQCPKGYHVDHIVPLNGETVCGLHVLYNLQYLTPEENIKKSNKLLEVF